MIFRRSVPLIVSWTLFVPVASGAVQAAAPTPLHVPTPLHAPPGVYRTSWVGNSFGGNGGPNGFGYWVQDGASHVTVTPDGTVIAGVEWDEAGRCVGLYRNGMPNRVLLQGNTHGPETAWGWNTGNNAVAANGEYIYVGNIGKRLLRFRWTPGDINSAHYLDEAPLPAAPVAMSARGGRLALAYKDRVELRRASDLTFIRAIPAAGVKDLTLAPDGSLWIVAGNAVRQVSDAGESRGGPIPGLQRPSAVLFDNRGRLIVCDDGAREQVLFFDVTGAPRLVRTFGIRGGIEAGRPGLVAPQQLFALRGAGTDAQGNLYVGMSFGNGPNGNLYLRSFSPAGALRWSLFANAFVDTFGFDPASDGRVVYTRTAVFHLDLARTRPGSEQQLYAISVDPNRYPADPRVRAGCTALIRWPGGRKVLYTIGQYAGGYDLFTFDDGAIAHKVDHIGGPEQWAWDIDSRGDIWHGDAPGKTIRHYPFLGWVHGKPHYDWSHPQTWPWPAGWQLIRRIAYDRATDALYLGGYLDGQRVETWGVVGATARRYDGWLKGGRRVRWTQSLPRDGNTDPKEGPLTPQAMSIAGDYMFLGTVKPTFGTQPVYILRLSDGGLVGALRPGPATGQGWGWEDMPYALQAIRRRNGEYLLLVEEDWRAKNLLYRWRP